MIHRDSRAAGAAPRPGAADTWISRPATFPIGSIQLENGTTVIHPDGSRHDFSRAYLGVTVGEFVASKKQGWDELLLLQDGLESNYVRRVGNEFQTCLKFAAAPSLPQDGDAGLPTATKPVQVVFAPLEDDVFEGVELRNDGSFAHLGRTFYRGAVDFTDPVSGTTYHRAAKSASNPRPVLAIRLGGSRQPIVLYHPEPTPLEWLRGFPRKWYRYRRVDTAVRRNKLADAIVQTFFSTRTRLVLRCLVLPFIWNPYVLIGFISIESHFTWVLSPEAQATDALEAFNDAVP